MCGQVTEEERNHVPLAFEESEEDYNLIKQKDAFKKPQWKFSKSLASGE